MAATIELYLVRHAIAAERGPKYPDDRLRPLTPAGAKKFAESIPGLSEMDVVIDFVLTSPLVRARETAQIANHIKATRQAWALDSVEIREVGTEARLTPQTIAANRATIDNVRLWDWRAFHDTVTQLQALRQYYVFADTDVDRYTIDGQLRQVMLTPREMVPSPASVRLRADVEKPIRTAWSEFLASAVTRTKLTSERVTPIRAANDSCA